MRPRPNRPIPIREKVIGSGTPETGDSVADQVELIVFPAPDSHIKMLPMVSVQVWAPDGVQPAIVPLRVVEKFPTYAVLPVVLEPT
jgi:hypothetical protein